MHRLIALGVFVYRAVGELVECGRGRTQRDSGVRRVGAGITDGIVIRIVAGIVVGIVVGNRARGADGHGCPAALGQPEGGQHRGAIRVGGRDVDDFAGPRLHTQRPQRVEAGQRGPPIPVPLLPT